jgi:hypothetical protein
VIEVNTYVDKGNADNVGTINADNVSIGKQIMMNYRFVDSLYQDMLLT